MPKKHVFIRYNCDGWYQPVKRHTILWDMNVSAESIASAWGYLYTKKATEPIYDLQVLVRTWGRRFEDA